jgi:uncharacterized protein (UPF0332 family)
VQAWDKAKRDLAEARALDLSRTPGAAIHQSYYAMHHAARAVLLRRDGETAPTKHNAVIGRFGQIAKNEPPQNSEVLIAAGRDINRVYEERLISDYRVEYAPTQEEAEACVAKAERFLKVYGQHFGFEFD